MGRPRQRLALSDAEHDGGVQVQGRRRGNAVAPVKHDSGVQVQVQVQVQVNVNA